MVGTLGNHWLRCDAQTCARYISELKDYSAKTPSANEEAMRLKCWGEVKTKTLHGPQELLTSAVECGIHHLDPVKPYPIGVLICPRHGAKPRST